MSGIFFSLALAFYLLSTVSYLISISFYRKIFEKIAHYSLAAGIGFHLVFTAIRYFELGYTPITNLQESLSFFSLCSAICFFYFKKRFKIEILGTMVLPAISVLLIWAASYSFTIKPLPPHFQSFWLPVHTIFSFLGNAVFLISFFVSLFYLVVEKGIKKKKISSLSDRVPSLETLDLINYRCMSIGFPLLTAGIITGSLWAGMAWGSYWNWDPKETWSLITWIVYAILVHNRLAIGWRGKRTAYMMIIGFFFILFTFFCVNLYIGGLHSYV